MLDQYGNVVGVVVSKLDAFYAAEVLRDLPQNVNFAIKAATVISFLEANNIRPKISDSTVAIAPAEIPERARLFTVQIVCRPGQQAQIPFQEQPPPPPPSPVTPPQQPAQPPEQPPPRASVPQSPPVAGGAKTLLGQYDGWGAYTASSGGKKICFAIARPISSETNPLTNLRDPSYMMISSRPGDNVRDEVSIIAGYPFKPNSKATMEVGSTSFAFYTQEDSAWINNPAEEAHMVELMRAGQYAVVKGVSVKGTQSTDTYVLRGLSDALDRTAQECR